MPKNNRIPQHDIRSQKDGLHPDIVDAYSYVESVSDTADNPKDVMWHGWALREAFLAGVTHGQETKLSYADVTDGFFIKCPTCKERVFVPMGYFDGNFGNVKGLCPKWLRGANVTIVVADYESVKDDIDAFDSAMGEKE